MADDPAVDHGGHHVFPLRLRRVYADLADLHFPPVHLLPVPSLTLVKQRQVAPVYGRIGSVQYIFLRHRILQRPQQLLFLPLPLGQLPSYFRVQADVDTPLAVEDFHRYRVGEVLADDAVQCLQPPFDGVFLDGAGGQRGRLFFRQVVDHIGRDTLRLYGQRPPLRIHDQPVRGEALQPFLVGEIDRRGDQLLVGPGRFPAARDARHRFDDRLQLSQYVLLHGGCLRLPVAFVVESVSARLHLAGLHAPVPSFGNGVRSRIEEPPADPPQVEAPLVARRPAQKRRGHAQPSQPSVLADAYAVAVQPHGYAAVGVAGMDEILGQVEIFRQDTRQHVVGFLVGRERPPVREREHLPLGDRVTQQRRVVPLHEQPVAPAVERHVGLKPVAHQYVAQLGLQVHLPGIGIRSYRHSPVS